MIITNNQGKSSFAKGALLLALSAIAVKVIGVCYKIPLVNLLGTQGMGYFNAAYDVYALLCMVSTTGLPVAVSVVINRRPSEQRRVYLLSLATFAVLGGLGAAAVFFGAEQIAVSVGAPAAAQSLRFIAPAVLFVCLSGAYRGYYQAKRHMNPTAISQVIEAAGKLLFGLVFARISIRMDKGTAAAAAFAVLGLSAGTLLSFLYLALCGKQKWENACSKELTNKQLLGEMLIVAFPVTLGALLAGISKVIDLSLIMRRLQDGGVSQGQAIALYGCYSSMVIPLFNVIPAMLGSLSLPIVPYLGHAIVRQDEEEQKHIISIAFRWVIALSIPASLGMGMLSSQILQVLFSDVDSVQIAEPLLITLSMALPASCMITVTSAVLQAYGHAWLPMVSTAIGCAAKAVFLYVFCAIPQIGILAAPISTFVCCLLTACFNLRYLERVTPSSGLSSNVLRALAASAIAVGTAALLQRMVACRAASLIFGMGFTVVSAILIYLPIAIACGLIRISDIKIITSKKKRNDKHGYSTKD